MENQKVAIKRLQSKVAKVSTHYVISKNGTVYQMVDDLNIAWHAGKSKWGRDTNLNSKSIGIELVNKGNEKFPLKQIRKLSLLIKFLKKKHKIKKEHVLGHSHIAPNRKFDPVLYFHGLIWLKKGYLKCIELVYFSHYIAVASWLNDSF